MLRGLFNSIILVKSAVHAAVTIRMGGRLLVHFNGAAEGHNSAAEAHSAPQPANDTVCGNGENNLRNRFNTCNDAIGFSGENRKKAARVQALMDMLREIVRRVAEGTATLSEALGIVGELESLGIRVHGMPFYAPAQGLNHTKIQYHRVAAPKMAA